MRQTFPFAYRPPAQAPWRPHLAQGEPSGLPPRPPPQVDSVSPILMLGAGAGLGALAGTVVSTALPKTGAPRWVSTAVLALGGVLGTAAVIFPIFGATDSQRNTIAFAGGLAASLGVRGLAR